LTDIKPTRQIGLRGRADGEGFRRLSALMRRQGMGPAHMLSPRYGTDAAVAGAYQFAFELGKAT
jgi:hypothetical protein